MLSDKVKSLIIAGALSGDPRYRAAAQTMADEEQYMLTAQALGVEETQREAMRSLARSIGPKTLLLNGEVWEAAWRVMLNYVKHGDPFLPGDMHMFAAAIWLQMYYRAPRPEEFGAFLSLVDAVKG